MNVYEDFIGILTCCLRLFVYNYVDYCAVLAMGSLLCLTPDVRTKPDHTKIVSILEVRWLLYNNYNDCMNCPSYFLISDSGGLEANQHSANQIVVVLDYLYTIV